MGGATVGTVAATAATVEAMSCEEEEFTKASARDLMREPKPCMSSLKGVYIKKVGNDLVPMSISEYPRVACW